MKIGYTQGTFDTLHFGHIRLLKNAKSKCDYLVVGVNSNELVRNYKKKEPIISEKERAEIVASIKYVDQVIIVDTLDKLDIHKKLNFNICFIGSDWKNSDRYNETEKQLKGIGVEMEYLPYTEGISSSFVRKEMLK